VAISSRWLDALQEQFLAEQAASPYDPRFGVDEAPDLSGMRVMDAPAGQPGGSDLVGSSSGMSQGPGSGSYLDQVIAGGAAGGVGGGLAALFADPNADRGASGANAWDMFRGITKSIGRAIGSAYGNPNFGLAAQRADSEAAADSARLDAYRQQVAAQIENDLQSRRESAEKRAREARLVTAMQGIDPTTARGNADAVRVATELGEYEVAAKLKGLLREEKPQSAPAGYRQTDDGSLEFIPGGPADPSVAERLSDARRAPRVGSSGGGGGGGGPLVAVIGPDGRPVLVPRSDAAGMTPASAAGGAGAASAPGVTTSTRTTLEKEQVDLSRDLQRLDESLAGFDPSLFTLSGRASRTARGLASKAGVLGEDQSRTLQEETGYLQQLQMVNADLINKLYGAALSEAEAKRAETFVVNPNDSPDEALAKMRGLREIYRNKLEANARALRSGVGGVGDGGGEMKTVNGVRYRKVPGGWEAVE